MIQILAAAALVLATAAHADPIQLAPGNIVRVYDGDTITVDLPGMLPVFGDDLGVRLLGIDTPEIVSRCPTEQERVAEKALAIVARQRVLDMLEAGEVIELSDLGRGKYFRLLARVTVDGRDVGQELIDAGLADAYDGGTRASWCGR